MGKQMILCERPRSLVAPRCNRGPREECLGTTVASSLSVPYDGGSSQAENVVTICVCIDVIFSTIATLAAIVYETMPDPEFLSYATHRPAAGTQAMRSEVPARSARTCCPSYRRPS